jgi:hypothetical protein
MVLTARLVGVAMAAGALLVFVLLCPRVRDASIQF